MGNVEHGKYLRHFWQLKALRSPSLHEDVLVTSLFASSREFFPASWLLAIVRSQLIMETASAPSVMATFDDVPTRFLTPLLVYIPSLIIMLTWILSSCYVAVLCLSVAILSPVLAATLVGGASVAVPTNCVDGYNVHSRFLTPQLVHLASFSSFVCLLCSQLSCVSHSLAFVVAVEFLVLAHCVQRGAGSPSADWNGAAASLTVWSHVTNMLSTCSSIAFFVYIWILTPSIVLLCIAASLV